MLLFREVSHPSVGRNRFSSKVGNCISKAGRKHGGSLESEPQSPGWCMAQMGRRCPPRPPPRVTPLPSRLDAAVALPRDQPEWRRSANRARGDGRKKSPSHNSSAAGENNVLDPRPPRQGPAFIYIRLNSLPVASQVGQ